MFTVGSKVLFISSPLTYPARPTLFSFNREFGMPRDQLNVVPGGGVVGGDSNVKNLRSAVKYIVLRMERIYQKKNGGKIITGINKLHCLM